MYTIVHHWNGFSFTFVVWKSFSFPVILYKTLTFGWKLEMQLMLSIVINTYVLEYIVRM